MTVSDCLIIVSVLLKVDSQLTLFSLLNRGFAIIITVDKSRSRIIVNVDEGMVMATIFAFIFFRLRSSILQEVFELVGDFTVLQLVIFVVRYVEQFSEAWAS